MKLELKMYETTLTWQEENDDLNSDEMLDIWIKLMTAFGYHPDSIKSSIIDLAEDYKNE